MSLLTRRPQPSFPHGAPHLASRVADWCGTRSRAEPLQQLADGEQAAAGRHRLPPSASSRASHLLPARPPGLPRPPHTGERLQSHRGGSTALALPPRLFAVRSGACGMQTHFPLRRGKVETAPNQNRFLAFPVYSALLLWAPGQEAR